MGKNSTVSGQPFFIFIREFLEIHHVAWKHLTIPLSGWDSTIRP
jgi:hypothetical protein